MRLEFHLKAKQNIEVEVTIYNYNYLMVLLNNLDLKINIYIVIPRLTLPCLNNFRDSDKLITGIDGF